MNFIEDATTPNSQNLPMTNQLSPTEQNNDLIIDMDLQRSDLNFEPLPPSSEPSSTNSFNNNNNENGKCFIYLYFVEYK